MKFNTYTCTFMLVFLSSTALAAEGAFFATASADYQISGSDILAPGCTVYPQLTFERGGSEFEMCTGSNPRAEFKLGYEFAFGDFRNNRLLPIIQFGYKHKSNWASGFPFNKDLEIWSDSVFLEFRIGGIR